MHPDSKDTTPALLSVAEWAELSGQTPAAIRSQIKKGTCAADVVLLRKATPGGGRPRYAVTRASVDKLLGEDTP